VTYNVHFEGGSLVLAALDLSLLQPMDTTMGLSAGRRPAPRALRDPSFKMNIVGHS